MNTMSGVKAGGGCSVREERISCASMSSTSSDQEEKAKGIEKNKTIEE
jgi:hypothetical protein